MLLLVVVFSGGKHGFESRLQTSFKVESGHHLWPRFRESFIKVVNGRPSDLCL